MSGTTSRLSAALADRYKLERRLGEGGMATVYLAEDLKHRRKVAVKVLRPELAAVLGAERFVQEITTTASLQHPNILPLFDSGEADSFLYYVMPYIDGETLREKLDRETQLSIEEAVQITTDVAEALQAAHEEGVIHRDIKPENILLHKGRAMVADFGIALAVSAAAGGRMTETGLSLGTPHYMSPEQATAEKEITARSDVYSLGTVLYEMLTGEPPHMGNSAQQIIMKIVTDTPRAVTELRKSVPPNVTAAVAKALEKLAADRFATASAFASALVDSTFAYRTASSVGPPAVGGKKFRPGPLVWSSWLVTALALAVLVTRPSGRSAETDATRRNLIDFPADLEPTVRVTGRTFAVSPDGRRWVYVTGPERATMLALKEENVTEPRLLTGTEDARDPRFSPDGDQVAFVRTSGWSGPLEVVPLAGGRPQVVTDSALVDGFTWADDGYLYFTGANSSAHLIRILPTGGRPDTLLGPTDKANTRRLAPIPGQRGVVFDDAGPIEPYGTMWALDTRDGHTERLGPGAAIAVLPSGHLLYHDGSAVFAVRFDLDRLRTVGEPVRVATGFDVGNLMADMAVSETGDLLYVTQRAGGGRPVWADRAGVVREIDPNWRDPVTALELSPDDSKLVARVDGSIVVKHLDSGPVIPLARSTSDVAYYRPAWHPNGESIGLESRPLGSTGSIQVRRADGVDADASQIESGYFVAWSPDGTWRLVTRGVGNGEYIVARPTTGGADSVVLGSGAFIYPQAQLSPDGRWLAYVSNETGSMEVFVRPFPNVDSTRIAVSLGGGVQPRWAGNGTELFFVSGANELMAARVALTPTFLVRTVETLFVLDAFVTRPQPYAFTYDVTEDGQTFVMAVYDRRADIVWVDGWMNELPAEMR